MATKEISDSLNQYNFALMGKSSKKEYRHWFLCAIQDAFCESVAIDFAAPSKNRSQKKIFYSQPKCRLQNCCAVLN